jgi:hypothetical protein
MSMGGTHPTSTRSTSGPTTSQVSRVFTVCTYYTSSTTYVCAENMGTLNIPNPIISRIPPFNLLLKP